MVKIIFYIVIAIIIFMNLFQIFLQTLNNSYKKKPIPEIVKDVYDQDKYQKWLNYSYENTKLSNINRLINFIIIMVFLLFGLFPKLEEFTLNISNNIYIQILLFIGIYYLISFIKNIIINYISTFKIEEKYGFNKRDKKTFILDTIKQLILVIILGGGLLYLISNLYYTVGSYFYLYAFISLIIIIILINMTYTKIFVPLFNKITPLQDGELKDKIYAFANKVGYNVNKISVIDASKRSTRLNAYFSGFGKFKHIMLYDTLIDKMTSDQILAVLAHEIGHYKHKDILFSMLSSVIMISIYLAMFLFILKTNIFFEAFKFNTMNFGFGLILFTILLEPIDLLISLLLMYFSRKHEYKADNFAKTHGMKDEIKQALIILTQENLSNLNPHPIFVKFNYSHPPLKERLTNLNNDN